MVGQEYSARELGHVPHAVGTSSAGTASFEGNLYLDSGEFLGKVRGVARQEASGAITDADGRSPYMRKGR
jgi:hypothetical protein